MNLSKAIEILDRPFEDDTPQSFHDLRDAIKLGREALKRDVKNRLINNHPDQAKLPGETPE